MQLTLKTNRSKYIHSVEIRGDRVKDIPHGSINPYSRSKSYCTIPSTPKSIRKLIAWAEENNIELDIPEELADHRFHQVIIRNLMARLTEADTTSTTYFRYDDLYEHQKEGLRFLLSTRVNDMSGKDTVRALLADDPRLGKSIQVLACANILSEVGKPILILCPKSLIWQWSEYVRDWYGKPAYVLHGDYSRRYKTLKAAHEHGDCAVIANWHTLLVAKNHEWENFFGYKWNFVIGDEAHCLRNWTSRMKVKRGEKPKNSISNNFAKGIVKKSKHIVLLSATFVEKSAAQWWATLHMVAPKVFTNKGVFSSLYANVEDGYGGPVYLGTKNEDLLRDELAPYCIQRKASDLSDIGDIIYTDIRCRLDDKHKQYYDKAKTQIYQMDQNGNVKQTWLNAAAMLQKLRQVSISPEAIDNTWDGGWSVKLELMKDILDGLPSDKQAIIYSSFVKPCMLACGIMKGGGVFAGKNSSMGTVKAFQEGKLRWLFMTTQRGVGLNLGNADFIIYLDLPWSTIELRQSEERARLLSKSEPIGVYRIIAEDTVDEKVYDILVNKQKAVDEAQVLKEILEWIQSA